MVIFGLFIFLKWIPRKKYSHHQLYYLGEYPSLCVRSMHAVPTQCKTFPMRSFFPPGCGILGISRCVPR